MSKGKKSKKQNKRSNGVADLSPEALVWLYSEPDDESGMREPPSAEAAAEINAFFQREFRKSDMWRGMIEDFGREKAEEMLKEMCVKGKDEYKD